MSAVSTSTDIRTLLKLALPPGSRQFTGYPETTVNWVCHLRTRPPIFADIEGGELVLVSTATLASYQKPLSLETVIEELIEAKASALGIQGTITPRARQVAQRYDFPLIALPDRAALRQVGRDVQRLLTNPDAQLSHRASELQQMLQRHAHSYRGLTTMLNALARMLHRPVLIHNARGDVVSRGLPSTREPDVEAELNLIDGIALIRQFSQDADQTRSGEVVESLAGLSAPLVSERRLLGCISVVNAGRPFDDFDHMALGHSVPTFVREMARQQTVELSVEHAPPARDWISDWLNSAPADDALLTLRAEKDGFCQDLWYAVALFRWTPPYERHQAGYSAERIARQIRTELRQRRIQAPVGQHLDRAVLIFPLDEPQQTQRLKQMITLLHAALTLNAEGEFTIGVGQPAMGLTNLRESVREAERALTLSEQLWDDSQVSFFGDVSLYELLLGVHDPDMLTGFCQRWLSALLDYDDKHHTDLLPTLNAYFANNGNMARTAHVLNIHRNTLVYRLSRITEIIQLDMDDPNVRLNLHLALKIQRMLDATADSD